MSITINIGGVLHQYEVCAGTRLSLCLSNHCTELSFPCGGRGTCKNCRIIAHGNLSVPDDEERCAFTSKQLAQGWRLACRTTILGDCDVFVDTPQDTMIVAMGESISEIDHPFYSKYGLSVDIGTTTLCAHLCSTSGTLASAVCRNPQVSFGSDVNSRIESATSGSSDSLRDIIWLALHNLANETASKAGIIVTEIDAAVLTGNTTMLYLLAGYIPNDLAVAPFDAKHLFGKTISCSSWCSKPLPLWERVYLPPCISAFVGADITTAILASGICTRKETALLVDIGTNGEIALWTDGRLLRCCSTAAGPAFEGADLSHGVCGVSGAVDHVWIEDGDVRYSTINDEIAVGICGSGIVDALAVMLHLGVIDETGAFCIEPDSFEIAPRVFVTGEDVRMMQLAKGAVRAGIETLLAVAEIDTAEVVQFYVAGGFGSYLNLKSAAVIGLLDKSWLDRVKVIGNAAHTGATMVLMRSDLRGVMEKIAHEAELVLLHDNVVFSRFFMDSIIFPL